MRRFRAVCFVILATVVLAAPTSFAKVCHPKVPLTCTAAHLTQAPADAVVVAPVKKAHESIQPLPAQRLPKVQQAMICGPWVRWMCTATPGLI